MSVARLASHFSLPLVVDAIQLLSSTPAPHNVNHARQSHHFAIHAPAQHAQLASTISLSVTALAPAPLVTMPTQLLTLARHAQS